MKFYIIKNIKTGELWSNECGWVDEGCDVFLSDEKTTLNLPIDGEWICLDWLA